MKIVKKIQLKIVIFTPVKNRCILHGHVWLDSREVALLSRQCTTKVQTGQADIHGIFIVHI